MKEVFGVDGGDSNGYTDIGRTGKGQTGDDTSSSSSRTVALEKRSPGGFSEADPPVPISNTEVKRLSADDTALATGWENRPPPGAIFFVSELAQS